MHGKHLVAPVLLLLFLIPVGFAASAAKKKPASTKSTQTTSASANKKTGQTGKSSALAAKPVVPSSRTTAAKSSAKAKPVRAKTKYRSKSRRYYSAWDTPSFADSTIGDSVDGEDLTVRRAAVAALGPLNGSVVVADPSTGRILTIVNQKLALTGAYQPCSTIKLVAGMAALNEGLIDRETKLRLSRRTYMNLTWALAKSDNPYFAKLGNQLGFEKVYYYARMFGLGEKAGYNIEGESPGIFPDSKPSGMAVGLMTSFGEAIGITPLQLAALITPIANGGTLYYLQYPKSQEDILTFEPRVKRYLEIQAAIPEMKPGMMGAVDFGTARRAMYDMNEPIFGKTGTCTDARTHLGWFGSFNEIAGRKLVVAVLLTGGRQVSGPVAAGVGGKVYQLLSEQQYFAGANPVSAPSISNAPESGTENLSSHLP
jgi:membrane carboxypeptidase/penicillin-binding protein